MLNIIEFLTVIANIEQPAEKLAKEFVVKVNDRGSLYERGEKHLLYKDELIKLINKYEKTNRDVANKIKYGTYIIFKKNRVTTTNVANEAYDYELPVYSLVEDNKKVVKTVKNFFENVYEEDIKTTVCGCCPLYALGICDGSDNEEIIWDGQFINVEEKVTIFDSFVKVGYSTYKIKSDIFGDKYVTIEGERFQVKSLAGKRYLVYVK